MVKVYFLRKELVWFIYGLKKKKIIIICWIFIYWGILGKEMDVFIF